MSVDDANATLGKWKDMKELAENEAAKNAENVRWDQIQLKKCLLQEG